MMDLSLEWKECCSKAIGIKQWMVDDDEDDDDLVVSMINLLPDRKDDNNDDFWKEWNDDDDESEDYDDAIKNKKMYYNDYDRNNKHRKSSSTTRTSVTSRSSSRSSTSNTDPWMITAVQIQSNLEQMSRWILQKMNGFVFVGGSEEEVTLVQSTVTSFIATTASEIESLSNAHSYHSSSSSSQRKNHHQLLILQSSSSSSSIPSFLFVGSEQYHQHCYGIIQILGLMLQKDIIEPFTILQKQRHRTAIQLWQKPFCSFITILPKEIEVEEEKDQVNDDDYDYDYDDDRNSRYYPKRKIVPDVEFIPSQPTHRLHQDFYTSYEQELYDTKNSLLSNPITTTTTTTTTKNKWIFHRPKSNIFVGPPKKKNSLLLDDDVDDTDSRFRHQLLSQQKSPLLTSESSSNTSNISTMKFRYNRKQQPQQPQQQQQQQQQQQLKQFGSIMHDTAAMRDYNEDNIPYSSPPEDEQLRQESILIQEAMSSTNYADLDNIQQMERKMLDITTLLTQFAELAAEQQEDVWDIHKTTVDAKDNVDQGTNQLLTATEKTQSSQHYMATTITILGILLLFLNWIIP